MLSSSSCPSCVWMQASPLNLTNVVAFTMQLALSLSRHTLHIYLYAQNSNFQVLTKFLLWGGIFLATQNSKSQTLTKVFIWGVGWIFLATQNSKSQTLTKVFIWGVGWLFWATHKSKSKVLTKFSLGFLAK